MSNTIRGELVDAINELRQLLFVTTGTEQMQIRQRIQELLRLLDRVIAASLDPTTKAFKDALKSLQGLTQQTKKAKQDVEKVAGTIQKAADAIAKVENLVTNVAGFL